MEAEAEIFEPLDLRHSDLLLLSSPPHLRPSGDSERLEALSRRVVEALGPGGPGLLCVSGVPGASALRRALLPLARRLALLRPPDRTRILKIHGIGTDVPMKNLDRMVSSFALQLKYPADQHSDLNLDEGKVADTVHENFMVDHHINTWEDEFQTLGCTFRQLGLSMMDLGLHVARICDRAIGFRDLEKSILESHSAKGRLIHYHSTSDNIILKEIMKKMEETANKKVGSNMQPQYMTQKLENGLSDQSVNKLIYARAPMSQLENVQMTPKMTCQKTSLTSLWQHWHYDYGIFTILTAPMFLSSYGMLPKVGNELSDVQECLPDNHTYLQLCMPSKNKIFLVKSSPESFIVQIGEAADILSRGKLRSTLHSVGRPYMLENISRETFVVFMQPTWDKILHVPEYMAAYKTCKDKFSEEEGRNCACKPISANEEKEEHDSEWLKHEILKSVPPLSSRLRDGMTFAEFSKETTRQYYGGNGIQSNKRDI